MCPHMAVAEGSALLGCVGHSLIPVFSPAAGMVRGALQERGISDTTARACNCFQQLSETPEPPTTLPDCHLGRANTSHLLCNNLEYSSPACILGGCI